MVRKVKNETAELTNGKRENNTRIPTTAGDTHRHGSGIPTIFTSVVWILSQHVFGFTVNSF